MRLTPEEQGMLAGEQGRATQRAMEIIVTLGHIYEAERLLDVHSVQVAGVSYRNLGEAGLEFLRDWAAEGARVRVPTTLNPAGMDLVRWQHMGIPQEYARKQLETIEVYAAMGIQPTCTCAPYLVGNVPGYGEHIAWSESSAVVYANSVLGARTNREGGPSALAAAICGRTAEYGLHCDANRRATLRVEVRCAVCGLDEYAALGYLVGRDVGGGVPYFVGLSMAPLDAGSADVPQEGTSQDALQTHDALKLLGAALASSGAVALYHVQGVTPEACIEGVRPGVDLCPCGIPRLVIESLEPAITALNASVESIDLVVIGCPHASLEELRQVATLITARSPRGQRLVSDLWVTMPRRVREQGEALGLVQVIEEAGGQVIADGCVVVAPMQELPYHTLATNSAKMASYALPHAGLQVRFGSLERCIDAAITGCWPTHQP